MEAQFLYIKFLEAAVRVSKPRYVGNATNATFLVLAAVYFYFA